MKPLIDLFLFGIISIAIYPSPANTTAVNFISNYKDSIPVSPTDSLPNTNSLQTDSTQIEISDIMFGKNMATGILHVDVSENTECTINIYAATDQTLLFSSDQQRNFSLFPGTYEVEISGMLLKNILVYKGMDTRIKAGALHILSTSIWTLYDTGKVKKIYTASGSKKVEFPKGAYALEINAAVNQIEIKDGEILDSNNFRKAVVQVQKSDTVDSVKNIIVKPTIINPLPEEKKWELKPNTSLKGNSGRIILNISKDVECVTIISNSLTQKEMLYSGALTNGRNFSLIPGNYDIKISGSSVKNMPVQKGMDTRIKAGILNVVTAAIWTLYDEKKISQVYFSTSAKKIGLPIGTYQIEVNGTVQPIIIKDGETLDLKN